MWLDCAESSEVVGNPLPQEWDILSTFAYKRKKKAKDGNYRVDAHTYERYICNGFDLKSEISAFSHFRKPLTKPF